MKFRELVKELEDLGFTWTRGNGRGLDAPWRARSEHAGRAGARPGVADSA